MHIALRCASVHRRSVLHSYVEISIKDVVRVASLVQARKNHYYDSFDSFVKVS